MSVVKGWRGLVSDAMMAPGYNGDIGSLQWIGKDYTGKRPGCPCCEAPAPSVYGPNDIDPYLDQGGHSRSCAFAEILREAGVLP